MIDGRWLTLVQSHRIESGTVNTHSILLKIAYEVNNKYFKHNIGVVVAKLKLRNTKQTEGVRELLCMANGVPYQPTTIRLLGWYKSSEPSKTGKRTLTKIHPLS